MEHILGRGIAGSHGNSRLNVLGNREELLKVKHIFFLLGQGKAEIDDIVWTGVPQPSGGFSGNTWLWLGFSEMALLVQKKVVPLLLFLGSIRRSQMNKVCHDALHSR